MSHTTQEGVLDACREALAWLGAGMPEQSRKELWASLEAVAGAAAWAAAGWAAWAAREAAWEAEAAGGTARWVAREAAREAAADRIADAILSSLEKECGL